MEATAILCNHAEVAEGKLYIAGGAITLLSVPTVAPPFPITAALAVLVKVPYTSTNQPHKLTIEMVGQDNNEAVVPWSPEGAPPNPPIKVETTFTIGRSALLLPGEAQFMPFAVNMPGLPLAEMGSYAFVVSISDQEMTRIPFRLVGPPQQPLGFGPTAVPPGAL